MASLATELPALNIDLEKIRKILIDGNDNLCSSNECRKAKIATIQSGKSIKISSDPEYKYGDEQALSVYKKCFPTSNKKAASCRLCFYKLDDDEKKRKAMLKKPVNKRTGAKSKESHGKTFEGNINECISSYVAFIIGVRIYYIYDNTNCKSFILFPNIGRKRRGRGNIRRYARYVCKKFTRSFSRETRNISSNVFKYIYTIFRTPK